MKIFVSLFLCLSLSVFAVARSMKPAQILAVVDKSDQKTSAAAKADGKTLMADASKALAAMIKAARADNGPDSKTPKNKPIWKSTQLIAKNLKMTNAGLSVKSNDFFKGVTGARQAEEQMKVDWGLTDSKNKEVIENGKKLGHAIALFRTDFSKEAARKKKGGELTATGKAEFEKIKAQQKELLAKIAKLEAGAKKEGIGERSCSTRLSVSVSSDRDTRFVSIFGVSFSSQFPGLQDTPEIQHLLQQYASRRIEGTTDQVSCNEQNFC